MLQPSHDNLETRLRTAASTLSTDADFMRRVLDRIAAENVYPQPNRSLQLRRWIMRSSIGLAAGVGIAVGIWSLTGAPQSAYAIADLSKRILSLNSLHLKGAMYLQGSTEPHPLELYAQQPDRCRVNGRVVDDNGKISTSDMIVTADQIMVIEPTQKTVTIGPTTPSEAKMYVAEILQGEMQLLVGPTKPGADFKKIRNEKVMNVPTDVYEVKPALGVRAEIWFNPATGLPVQTKIYRIEQDKVEHLMARFDTIEADQPISSMVFQPPVPVGYTVVHPKPTPSSTVSQSSGGSGSFGNSKSGSHHVALRYLVQLDNGNLLICWSLYNGKNPGDDLKLPGDDTKLSIHSDDRIKYTEHLLHADATTEGWHWRWSLLRPSALPEGSFTMIWMDATDSSRDRVILSQIPTIYRADDLAEQVEALQRATLPADGTPMTLQQIEQFVNGGR